MEKITLQKKYLQNIPGMVTNIFSPKQAEIQFKLDGNIEKAYLDKNKFYYNARVIPFEEPLDKYIQLGTEVIFSCRTLYPSTKHPFHWVVLLCYRQNQSPGLDITISVGWVGVRGTIFCLKKRHGVLVATDTSNNEHKVYFLASKVYLHGKRLPASKLLCSELRVDDNVFFDAVPCIASENEDNCRWFATCVFKGQKPDLSHDKSENVDTVKTKDIAALRIIHNCFNNPRTMFIYGKGIIFQILTDELGIILAQFQFNIYKQVVFHKKNTFVFGTCLSNVKLPEILRQGDRVKFVAVGTPNNFIIDWIAIQVAVCDVGEYSIPNFNQQIRLNNVTETYETNSL